MDHKKSYIPDRFAGSKLDNLDRDYEVPPEGHPLDVVSDWLAYPHDHISEDGVGLLLAGRPGRGKTVIAACVGMALLDQGFSVFFVTLADYIRYHLNAMDTWRAYERAQDYDMYLEWKTLHNRITKMRNEYDVVILDDVGKEHATASRFAEDEFHSLLRHRFDRGLPTIMTTNVDMGEWTGKYSEAMESFIREAFIIVPVISRDRRKTAV